MTNAIATLNPSISGTGCDRPSASNQDAVDNAHDFIGTTGNGDRFAPGTCLGYAQAMLAQDICFDVVLGADDQQGEDAWIGVDLDGEREVSHCCGFTPDSKPKPPCCFFAIAKSGWLVEC